MLLSNVISDTMLCLCSGAVIKVKCKARHYQPRRALAHPHLQRFAASSRTSHNVCVCFQVLCAWPYVPDRREVVANQPEASGQGHLHEFAGVVPCSGARRNAWLPSDRGGQVSGAASGCPRLKTCSGLELRTRIDRTGRALGWPSLEIWHGLRPKCTVCVPPTLPPSLGIAQATLKNCVECCGNSVITAWCEYIN